MIGLAAGMDLAVDDAGDDPLSPEILGLAGGGRRALADLADLAAADGDIAVLDDPVGQHDIAAEDEIEIAHVGYPVILRDRRRRAQPSRPSA